MSQISIISRTQKIVIDPFSSAVAVINAGPPGPSGIVPGVIVAGTPVAGANWTLAASLAVKSGNVMAWRLRCTRSVSELVIDAKGSFPSVTLGTLPVEWRSLLTGAQVANGAHPAGRSGSGDLTPNTGVVRLCGVGGSTAIAIGENITLGGVYILS